MYNGVLVEDEDTIRIRPREFFSSGIVATAEPQIRFALDNLIPLVYLGKVAARPAGLIVNYNDFKTLVSPFA